MEGELRAVVRHLVAHRWPFRLHATYDESISRMLDVFEAVNREVAFDGLRWFFDHAETISPRNIDRVAALRGGVAVQDRMAFQGERFVERYGADAAAHAPPIKRLLAAGVPVGAGSDATRVSSYNPWVTLHWLVTGKALGGLAMSGPGERMTREEALRLHTSGSAWFSSEDAVKGRATRGAYADLAVLSADYMSVPADEISGIESVLTLVDGKVVHAAEPFRALAPPAPAVSPNWSPVGQFGGAENPVRPHACHGHDLCGA
jgi:predicted amidohydrolase YtcJ